MKIEPAQQHILQHGTDQNRLHAQETGKSFSQLMDTLKAEAAAAHAASAVPQSVTPARLNGDYLSSFDRVPPTEANTHAKPQGEAAASLYAKDTTIDKTSPLYQQALELESYFVKIMLDSMRSGLHKTDLTGKNSFAGNMYQDMMYEQLSRTVTAHAGLGLADQIYLQLNRT
ncbi:MAG: rod-binding protein [Treponema sp.]